ncbi:MAG: TIGR00730 family Rossman fold protein, partial [Nitrospinaceae bacterium]|nr:TIGR00730 family Rossman fold protein [Nitrospinaceae bacterium]
VDGVYHEVATDLGRQIARLGFELVYGGASIGLMGAVARGVHAEGGKVVGVIPEFFRKKDKEIEYADADELIVTEDMRSRKAIMDERASAFIVLPGGIGTLEEAMEIMSMKQLGLTNKPLVFINTNKFYDGLIANLKEMVDLKFAKASTLELFTICPGPAEALDFILTYHPEKSESKWL